MSKKQINIKENVMKQINENKISMKPKSYFVLGSVFTFIGLVTSIISSLFLISIINFLLKEHGPMGNVRLSLMLDSFPWWLPVIACITLIFGIWNLLKYDFSYKTNYIFLIIGFILTMIVAGLLIDITGVDTLWLKQGPMKGIMRQYQQKNNAPSKFYDSFKDKPRQNMIQRN